MLRRALLGLAIAAATSAGVAQAEGTLKMKFVYGGDPPKQAKIAPNKDADFCGKKDLFDESLIDEPLNHEMNLVVDLASLGHAARNKENLKVRQPLAECAFSVGLAEDRPIIAKYADILEEELNVKKVRPLDAASEAMDFTLKPFHFG